MKKGLLVIGAVAGAIVVADGRALAQPTGPGGFGPPFMHGHGGMAPGMQDHMGMMMGPAMMGMRHDGATMAQMGVIHALFANHGSIKRTVANLPDGIRTVTESDDPQVAALIKEHVASMHERVARGDDPGLPIESPSLRAIFKNYQKIQTRVEQTAKGIAVVQTSNEPTVVADLQQHASEVTDFVREGMIALHAAMMRNGGGMMHGPMMGGSPDGMMDDAMRGMGRVPGGDR
jgi:hypothetical protein